MSVKYLVPILLPADPAVAMEAATKQYVDAAIAGGGLTQAVADTLYVNVTGDTMSGALIINPGSAAAIQLRHSTDNPYVSWNKVDATRLGYIQANTTNGDLRIVADTVLGPIAFWTNGSETVRIRANATGEILTMAGTPSSYFYFRDASPSGTMKGYVGADATWGGRLTASVGDALLQASAGLARIMSSSGNPITFFPGGSEYVRFSGGDVLFGKTAQDQQTAGFQSLNNGDDAHNMCSTNGALNTPCLAINKISAGNANNTIYMQFRRGSNNTGSISSPSGGNTAFNTTSDYRVKDERGPIERPLERIKLLRPLRAHFHDEPDPDLEVETFIAHEVAEVAPNAVTGEKDAVDADGEIIRQQLDNSKLVPLLVAAVQQLTVQVEQLTARIHELETA